MSDEKWYAITIAVRVKGEEIEPIIDDIIELLCGEEHGPNEECPIPWAISSGELIESP